LLTIQNLHASYGNGPLVLHSVDLTVKQGEIVTIMGPNGSGKSTVLKSIFGLTKIHSGSIRFIDEELVGIRPENVIRRGIGYVPQGRSVFHSLTILENLQMGAFIETEQKIIERNLKAVFKRFPILKARQGQKAGLLSGGEQQMLSLGRALMLTPKLLLLDEPSLGLAPNLVKEMMKKITELRTDGVTILVVEQNAYQSLQISDRGYVLELGKNKITDQSKKILANKNVQRLYLGG